jgi:hypothetical protein
VVAIAERPRKAHRPKYAMAGVFQNEPEPVGLPPGSVPVEAVRDAIRSYRAGVTSAERLIAVVDRHGDALEREIARRAARDLTDFHRTIDRAAALAGGVSLRLAHLEWLRRFPSGPEREPVPLRCPTGGDGEVDVGTALAALRALKLPPRAAELAPQERDPRSQVLDARRGRAPAMAALADAGISTLDIGLAWGVDRRKVWAILTGHEHAPPGRREALERLVGADQAAIVLAAIPEHPRARRFASDALEALHAAGATYEDVACLVPARPATVRKWLSGTLRPAPHNRGALAHALEQLLGQQAGARMLELIPGRNWAPDF